MHIGKLAEITGTTTRTVRYYEEMGLLKPERRTSGGFRCYTEEELGRLRRILSLKALGFDLEQIRCILDKHGCNGTGGRLAADVLGDVKKRLQEVEEEIDRLVGMREKLVGAIDGLCRCLPCDVRLEERLCESCDQRREDEAALPFFHAIQKN